jgi:hypothetical protein
VASALVAVPLWWQFFGPQSYAGLEHGLRGNDAAAFTAFATRSFAGDPEIAKELSMNRTEENAFFGWPLVLLMIGLTIGLWWHAVARALAVTMLVMAWLSMGVVLVVAGEATSIPGPWMLLFDVPVFDSVLESRFALGCVPAVGILLALATEHVYRLNLSREWSYATRVVWFSVLVFALVPIAPTELEVDEREPVPAFFADGAWRGYVDSGGSVVVVPLPDTGYADPLHWQVAAGLGFPLVEGYFVGPGTDGEGTYGAVHRPTFTLFETVADEGIVPEVSRDDRADAVADLRYWRADVVALPVRTNNEEQLRQTVQRLLGRPGHLVADTWVWDVRDLTRTAPVPGS